MRIIHIQMVGVVGVVRVVEVVRAHILMRFIRDHFTLQVIEDVCTKCGKTYRWMRIANLKGASVSLRGTTSLRLFDSTFDGCIYKTSPTSMTNKRVCGPTLASFLEGER
jgi:hypothetical protein